VKTGVEKTKGVLRRNAFAGGWGKITAFGMHEAQNSRGKSGAADYQGFQKNPRLTRARKIIGEKGGGRTARRKKLRTMVNCKDVDSPANSVIDRDQKKGRKGEAMTKARPGKKDDFIERGPSEKPEGSRIQGDQSQQKAALSPGGPR